MHSLRFASAASFALSQTVQQQGGMFIVRRGCAEGGEAAWEWVAGASGWRCRVEVCGVSELG